ncbi:MAG: glyoxylate/hydroxypyruvate reductase A, partial [Maritimibacter sp.]
MKIQFLARSGQFDVYRPHLEAALTEAGVAAELGTDFAPGEVDYLVYAPHGGALDFTPYVKAKAVLGLWAGVESIITNPTLTMPYARMVDHGLTEGMVEFVVGHVLRHHLGMDQDICRTEARWQVHVPPLARNRRVGVLGLGALGSACAQALAGLN